MSTDTMTDGKAKAAVYHNIDHNMADSSHNLILTETEFKRYQAYFCHASADTVWVMNFINILESHKYRFKCAEYDRDFLGGKYVFDLFQSFMEYSHFIVIVLSPSFLESKWSMFQLYLAVQYSLDNNEGNIVPLLYKACDIPPCMKVFDPVDASKKGWEKTFIERLCSPAKRFPRNKGICIRDGRISIDALRTYTTRDVMSEPILEQANAPLSEHNYQKVKALYLRRDSKVNFLQETSDGAMLISNAARSSGESAQDKRDSGQKEKISTTIQEHITSRVLLNGQQTQNGRTGHSSERIDAGTILEIDQKLDPSSLAVGARSRSARYQSHQGQDQVKGRMNADILLQIHNNGRENMHLHREQFSRKRRRSNRKRRNADNVSPALIYQAMSGVSGELKPENHTDQPHICDTENLQFLHVQKVDIGDSKNVQFHHGLKVDIHDSEDVQFHHGLKSDIHDSEDVQFHHGLKSDMHDSEDVQFHHGLKSDIHDSEDVQFHHGLKSDIHDSEDVQILHGQKVDTRDTENVQFPHDQKSDIRDSEDVQILHDQKVDTRELESVQFPYGQKVDVGDSQKDGHDTDVSMTSIGKRQCRTVVQTCISDTRDEGYYSVNNISNSLSQISIADNTNNAIHPKATCNPRKQESLEIFTRHHSDNSTDNSCDSELVEVGFTPVESTEEAELMILQQTLPARVLCLGDSAKQVRERNGIGKKRVDADILLLKGY